MCDQIDGEHGETTLPPRTVERLRRFADRSDRTLEDVLHTAAIEFLAEQSVHRSDDPFFACEPPDSSGEACSAANVDEHLYGPMADDC